MFVNYKNREHVCSGIMGLTLIVFCLTLVIIEAIFDVIISCSN